MSENTARFGAFSGTLEEAVCPICPAPTPSRLVFQRPDGVGFHNCSQCNLLYASPRFSRESLLQIYETQEFISDTAFYDRWNYEAWKAANSDNSYYAQLIKLELISRFLDKKDRLLDFGCGTGLLCVEGRRQGYSIEGIDASDMLINIGQNILKAPVRLGHLEEFNPPQKYNGIVAWAVLEHIYNLVEIVERCHALLEKGGYLFLDVPNHRGLSDRYKTKLCQLKIRKPEFKHFGFPWHIYAFDRQSLDCLMKRCGFKPVLYEFRSHKAKQQKSGLLAKLIITLTQRFELSDYITLVAQKIGAPD